MPDIRIPKEAVIVQPDPISERIDRYHADMLALSTRFRDERAGLQAAFEADINALTQGGSMRVVLPQPVNEDQAVALVERGLFNIMSKRMSGYGN